MATEDELRQTRLNKAERLRDLGVLPYPNAFRTTVELEDKRRELVALADDESARAKLPLEDELAVEIGFHQAVAGVDVHLHEGRSAREFESIVASVEVR